MLAYLVARLGPSLPLTRSSRLSPATVCSRYSAVVAAAVNSAELGGKIGRVICSHGDIFNIHSLPQTKPSIMGSQ